VVEFKKKKIQVFVPVTAKELFFWLYVIAAVERRLGLAIS
jgi:hypothetical protein